MSRFFRNALATFEPFDKTFSSINKAFNDFANENKAFNDLMTRGKDLFGNVNGFVKEVHETLSDIKVEVPYDKVTDTLKYSTDNGTLDITVSSMMELIASSLARQFLTMLWLTSCQRLMTVSIS